MAGVEEVTVVVSAEDEVVIVVAEEEAEEADEVSKEQLKLELATRSTTKSGLRTS